MISILLLCLYYTVSTLFLLFYLPNLSVMILALILYLFPIIIHGYVLYNSKNKKDLIYKSISLPIISSVAYMIFAILSEKMSIWKVFVERNIVVSDEMTVQIAQSPLEMSQIIFVVILYLSISIVTYYIKSQKNKKGVKNLQEMISIH